MIVVSLYSYKGGSGRTVCTANLVGLLAKELNVTEDKPILLLDMDLDSAGLTHVLREYDKFSKSRWNVTNLLNGKINLYQFEHQDIFFNKDKKVSLTSEILESFQEAGLASHILDVLRKVQVRKGVMAELRRNQPQKIVDQLNKSNSTDGIDKILEDNIPAVGMSDVSEKFGVSPGCIRFIGAEQIGYDSIIEGAAKVTERLIELIEMCELKQFSAIVIDSASGRQQSALACHRVSSLIVYCSRLTYQFRIGTKYQLRQFIEYSEEENRDLPRIIILPLAIPQTRNKKTQKLKRFALDDLKNLSNEINQKTETHFIEKGIPEVESFKWFENILTTRENLDEDEIEALSVFKQVAEKIIRMH